MSEDQEESSAPLIAPAPKTPILTYLLGLNMLAALGAVGMLVYTKMMYKRPPITEAVEATKLKKKFEKPKLVGPPGMLKFEAVTINLAPPLAGTGGENRIHYATVAFAIETADQTSMAKLEEIRPLLQDRLISMLSKRQYGEVNSVQGRYLLRTQLRELSNQVAKEPLATDVYFTEFTVQ